MIVAIHQPSYWPWLGLINKIALADTFVILDNVNANKDSFQFKNLFYCNGEAKKLSIPVNYSMGIKIRELQFKNESWKKDHLNKIQNYYLKAPFFNEVFPKVQKIYETISSDFVVDFLIDTMKFELDAFHINTKFIKSSEIEYSGLKGDLVLDICLKTKANEYISGKGALNYMDNTLLDKFKKTNINIRFIDNPEFFYQQNRKYPFVPGLAGLDILFFLFFDDS